MFIGVSTVSLDAKGRIAVPARHRERLVEKAGSRLVVTVHPREHCLWMYPEDEWREVARKVGRLPQLKRQNQLLQRLLLGHASEVEMDGQGRILLSAELREYAGLEKRAAVIGQGNKFEIWDEEKFMGDREGWVEEANRPESELSEELENLTL